ncbi:MAG: ComF family protein [Verrucomicrobiota bacterium]|nr:ComF family protein [Limisphaera sp.]MDW8380641.1 ComF family protein [Verrucomicrobiota bacterium]
MLSFIYPRVCQVCRAETAVPRRGWIGPQCRRQVRPVMPPWCDRCGRPISGEATVPFECAYCAEVQPHFRFARAAVFVEGVVLQVIHEYKYRQALWFEPFLARLLIRAAQPSIREGGWDVVVPVPLHPVRERERGFNQASRLGQRLAQHTGLPMEQDWLERVRYTPTQTLLSRSERLRNVRGAFRARRGAPVQGRRIVLVDDVLTTGATTSACAHALRESGAEDVCVWTVARGL